MAEEKKLYSILDIKANLYGSPFSSINDLDATRGLQIAMLDPQIQLSVFPEDFNLYEIGSFNPENGKIDPTIPPRHVVSAVSVKHSILAANARKEKKNESPNS